MSRFPECISVCIYYTSTFIAYERNKDLEEALTSEESGEYIVVKPRQFLGSENFAKIAYIMREARGEYISAGKESHFRIPRET